MAKEIKVKSPKEASKIFQNIIKASVSKSDNKVKKISKRKSVP